MIDIFSAASWPTNAITPILKAIEDTLGVVAFGNNSFVY
jgi:glyceraldehyde-3-phosphate dehydrogenase/erythrose-4-phosphate dehydrogenase